MNRFFFFKSSKDCRRIGSEITTLRPFKDNDCTFGATESQKNSWLQELLHSRMVVLKGLANWDRKSTENMKICFVFIPLIAISDRASQSEWSGRSTTPLDVPFNFHRWFNAVFVYATFTTQFSHRARPWSWRRNETNWFHGFLSCATPCGSCV